MLDVSPLVLSFAVATAMFVALWPVSLWRRDASVVDMLWGVGFGVLAWVVWFAAGRPDDIRALILLALVTLWATRLGVYLIGRKLREPDEDPRYVELRKSWSPGFWWKSLFVVFALQAVLQWTLLFPVQRALTLDPVAFTWWNAIAVAIAVSGLAIEAVADAQLARHRRTRPRTAICDTGLWAWCRHPNYLGDMVFWWGVWAVAIPAAELWTVVAPLMMVALLRWVSGVPPLEQHLARTRPDFAAYQARTPMFIPRRPPRPRVIDASGPAE